VTPFVSVSCFFFLPFFLLFSRLLLFPSLSFAPLCRHQARGFGLPLLSFAFIHL
jgi:hypothetical protein